MKPIKISQSRESKQIIKVLSNLQLSAYDLQGIGMDLVIFGGDPLIFRWNQVTMGVEQARRTL